MSARISAGVALAAARELLAAGYRTAADMAEASWQDRVDALGRGHYHRYDGRTFTMPGEAAELCRAGTMATFEDSIETRAARSTGCLGG